MAPEEPWGLFRRRRANFSYMRRLCSRLGLDRALPWVPFLAGRMGIASAGLRVLGIFLIVVGFLVVSLAMTAMGEGDGIIIVFPFVIGNVGGLAAAVFTVLFFAMFILGSLLPWYTMSRKPSENEYGRMGREKRSRVRDSDTLEYIITTELPKELARSVYIEADREEVTLKSSADKGFLRRYSLPQGFEVGAYDYDYEENYLIIKLKLKRNT